jgi:dipeptidyl aminopeptidase/acylaminoacyl peptidase
MKRLVENPSGWVLALVAVLAVCGWRGWVLAQRPAHWQAIAREWGGVPQLGRVVIPNHGNTHLVFNQQTEERMGFFLCDMAARKVSLLSPSVPQFYGWSPDDTRLAYGLTLTNSAGGMALRVCDGETGKLIAELQHPAFQGAAKFAWLTARRFACLASAGVTVVEQREDGTWALGGSSVSAAVEATGLTRVSPTAVAWQEGNRIQRLEIGAGSPTTVWEAATARLEDFSWSDANGEYLLKCADEQGQYLLRYSPRTREAVAAGRIDPARKGTFKGQSDWLDDSPTFLSWQGGSPRTVRLSDDGLNTFELGTVAEPQAQRLEWVGGVTAHTSLNGNHLYIIGHPTNQPPGVWDFDTASGTLQCVVAGTAKRFAQAQNVAPVYGRLTNSAGAVRGYSLWQPTRLTPGKKYPLIIGQTVNSEMMPYEQTAANCGYYFAVVHRPYWMSKRLRDWPEDVLHLYEELARQPNVDTNRVYLWGRSAEAPYLTQLFQSHNPLWRGVVYCDTRSLPPPETMRGKHMFFITGSDAGDTARLMKYQDQALALGISVELYFQERSGHSPVCVRATRERTERVAQFLAKDR